MTAEDLTAIERRAATGATTQDDVAAMANEIRRLWWVNAQIRRAIGYKDKGTI